MRRGRSRTDKCHRPCRPCCRPVCRVRHQDAVSCRGSIPQSEARPFLRRSSTPVRKVVVGLLNGLSMRCELTEATLLTTALCDRSAAGGTESESKLLHTSLATITRTPTSLTAYPLVLDIGMVVRLSSAAPAPPSAPPAASSPPSNKGFFLAMGASSLLTSFGIEIFPGGTSNPHFGGHVKYLCPPTVPLFMPVGCATLCACMHVDEMRHSAFAQFGAALRLLERTLHVVYMPQRGAIIARYCNDVRLAKESRNISCAA